MKRLFIILTVLFLNQNLLAQNSDADPIKGIILLIEELAQTSEDEAIDFEQLYEHFTNILDNPINLNTATRNQLEQLYIINDFQISSILDYVKTKGPMLSIYELMLIHGFDEELASTLYPFVRVSTKDIDMHDSINIKKMLSRGKHQILVRGKQTIEKQAGYKSESSTQFVGSPLTLYTRYNYKFKDKLQWNLTTEKDAGEKYFDYYSAHIQYAPAKTLDRLIIGDFQAQFGQGLVLWNGFSLGKTSMGTSVRKRARGIYGYNSTDENKYFRGVATSFKFGEIEIAVFASHNNRDATIADSLENSFASLQSTGLHRTPKEIANKNSITENALGANIRYNYNNLRIGASAMWHKFGANYVKNIKPYNIFELNKSYNYNYSVDAQWSWRRMILFAETAFGANGKNASLCGASFNLENNIELALLYRNYARNYQSLYARGFSDGSKTANEEGFFIALTCTPFNKTKISGYFDIFRFPWLKYGVNSPSGGYSYALNIDYAPSQAVKMNLSARQKIKGINYPVDNENIVQTANQSNFHLRYTISYALSNALQMQNRIEYADYKKGKQQKENGFMVYQDIAYNPSNIPLRFSLRYAYFNTDSWASRIYAYESDMLYSSSIPAYFLRGSRWYINCKWEISPNIDLWLRASQTIYKNRDKIGSGISAIDGNKQSDIKIQLRLRF